MKNRIRENFTTRLRTGAFLLGACLLAAPVFRAGAVHTMIWTNQTGGDLLWSNPANWIGGTDAAGNPPRTNGTPNSTYDVEFNTTNNGSFVASFDKGVVNNIVDVNTTNSILVFRVQYPGFHTTQINPGVTLATTADQVEMFSYRGQISDNNSTGYVTIKGEGQMIIGNPSTPQTAAGQYIRIIQQGTAGGPFLAGLPFMETLDMSELNYFACAPAEIRLAAATGSFGGRATWLLAKTNLIICGYSGGDIFFGLTIGANTSTAATGDVQPAGSIGELQLGQENDIRANSIKVGGPRAQLGTMRFKPGLSNPRVKIRNVNGTSAVTMLTIGDNYQTTLSGTTPGLLSTSNPSTGDLDLSGGTVDILAVNIYMGRTININNVTAAGSAAGTLTWTDGTINCTGEMDIGALTRNSLATSTAVVNVRSNAVLLVGGELYIGFDNGTAAGTAVGTLNIAHGGQVTVNNRILEHSSNSLGTSTINVTNGSLTVTGTINVDTVNMAGGSISNIGLMTVATLRGAGTVYGPVTATNLIQGSSLGTLTISNNLTLRAGSHTFAVNSDTLAVDRLAGISNVTFSGTLVVNATGGGAAFTNGAAIQLFSAATYSGAFSGMTLPTLTDPGQSWDTSTLASDGTIRIYYDAGKLVMWTNVASGDLLWSNPANWGRTNTDFAGIPLINSVPTAGDTVLFGNLGDGALGATNVLGDVNNIVDADVTVGPLIYTALEPSYHTTLINPNVTLLVSNSFPAAGFPFSYRGALNDSTKTGYVTIKGAAMVVGNTNTPNTATGNQIEIYAAATGSGVDGAFMATLDMSDLNYFACAPGEIKVGASGTSRGTRGTWILAKTNLLIAGTPANTGAAASVYGIIIGSATGGDYQPGGSMGELRLGQENVLLAKSLKVGGARAQLGTMSFQSGLIHPTLRIRNVDGVSPALDLAIGDAYRNTATIADAVSTSNTSTGNADLSGGTVDILLEFLFVGRNIRTTGASTTRNGSANGTLTWTAGTISCSAEANMGVQDNNNPGSATGVINVRSNASLLVRDMYIGRDAARAADAINAAGTGNGTLNIVHGGQVTVTNFIVEDYSASTNGGSSTINLTNGTLTSYGPVTVDNLNVYSGDVFNTGIATVSLLRGAGTVHGPVTLRTNGILAPGNGFGTLTLTSNLLLSANTTNIFEVNTDTLEHDRVIGLSNVTYNGRLVITPTGLGTAITNGASAKIFDAQSYSGSFAAIVPPVPGPGFVWNTTQLAVTGTLGIRQLPVANEDTVARAAGMPLKILKSALLANDLGGPLTVTGTDTTSTNGAAITTDATYIYYTPPSLTPADDVTDRFGYTISDGISATNGTVVVTIAPASPGITLNITGVSTNGDGNYTLSLVGIPGQTYIVEAATNIVTPVWEPIGTNAAGTNGLWTFTDLEATNYPSRFYRTATP